MADKYKPWLGSASQSCVLGVKSYYVTSSIFGALKKHEVWPQDLRWDTLGIKKCNRGNGIRLVPIFLKSVFNYPGNRKDAVTPEIVYAIT